MCTMSTDNEATDDPSGQVGQKEAERILRLLDEAIGESRRSRREIERKLGWSQGYLGSLLRGRIALKVWHVFALARELELEPLSFFFIAAPPRNPNWILEQLGVPLPEEPAKPKKKLPPMDRDELEALVKDLLHYELEKAGLLNIYREPYSEDADFDLDLELSLKGGEPKPKPEPGPEPAHSK